jgi:ABC-type branched-subunit amino acid transport system substrate-binding protein
MSLGGCADKGVQKVPSPTATDPDIIQVGLLVSQTGASSDIGGEVENGVLVAESQINALGGVLGKQLQFVVMDDQSDPTVASKSATQLLNQGIVLGIGPTTDAQGQALANLILGNQVLYISASATAQSLDDLAGDGGAGDGGGGSIDSPVLFRTAPSNAYLAAAMAYYATSSVNDVTLCQVVDILYQNDDYGTPIAKDLQALYVRLEYTVLPPVQLDPNTTEAASLMNTAQTVAMSAGTGKGAMDVQCQIVIAQPAVADAYMLAFKEYTGGQGSSQRDWSTFVTIGSDGFRQASFITNGWPNPAAPTGPTAGEGSYAVAADTTPDPKDTTLTADYGAFLELYEAHYPGQTPGTYASTAYDAAILLAGAIVRAQSATSISGIRNALYNITEGTTTVGTHDLVGMFTALQTGQNVNYSGASGTCQFNRGTGDVVSNFGVWSITNATYLDVAAFTPSELTGTVMSFQ